MFVADWGNYHIQKFSSNGTFITKWGSYGSNDGQFDNLLSVAVERTGNVYTADNENDRIQKFDSNGHFIATWVTMEINSSIIIRTRDLDLIH